MSFWSKLFGGGVVTVPAAATPAADTFVPPGTTQPASPGPLTSQPHSHSHSDDLTTARQLAHSNRWSEALVSTEALLALPEDYAGAKSRLLALQQSESQSADDAAQTTACKEASSPAKTPHFPVGAAMALRGQCLGNLLKGVLKASAASGAGTSPEFTSLRSKANQHVQLITEIEALNSDMENLVWVISLLHFLGNPGQARDLLQKMMQLTPNSSTSAMLKIAAKRLDELAGS